MSYLGKCLCEAIVYEVSGEPLDAGYCHCTLCHRSTGAPTVAWGTVRADSLRILKGAPRYYQSSAKARRGFCADCGTQLTFQYIEHPKTIDFTLGSLEHPSIVPQYHIWTSRRLAWFETADDLPRYAERGPDNWE